MLIHLKPNLVPCYCYFGKTKWQVGHIRVTESSDEDVL